MKHKLIIALIATILAPTPLHAISQFDLDRYYASDIRYYDAESHACISTAGTYTVIELQGSDAEEQIWNYLTSDLGISNAGAAGIVANLHQESGYNPNAGSRNVFYGIAQWSTAWFNTLVGKYPDEPPDTLATQLIFLRDGLENKTGSTMTLDSLKSGNNAEVYKYRIRDWQTMADLGLMNFAGTADQSLLDRMNAQTDPGIAAVLFHDAFERSGDAYIKDGTEPNYIGQLIDRINYAASVMQKYGDPSYTPTSSFDPCNQLSNASIAALAVSFSWPDEAHYTEIKPEYLAALQRQGFSTSLDYAQDCGHFVSTVMRDSGADPNYPAGGTTIMGKYMLDHPELYQEIENTNSTDNLLPGDIFIVPPGGGTEHGHILFYVGPQTNGYNAASASYLSRTANLQNIFYSDFRGDYRIYRFIGAGASYGGPADQPIGNMSDPSENVACDPRTTDLGVHDGYTNGSKLSIRLCALPNLPSSGATSTPNSGFYIEGANQHAIVNSRVSGAFYSLVEAAKTSGINLTSNSSFRSMAQQESLWASNPNPTFVAKPGYSNHQLGIAIDFDIPGSTTSSSSCVTINGICTPPNDQSGHYAWLTANAPSFGIHQYKNEFWHFSPTGN
jgi:hypothetical protein